MQNNILTPQFINSFKNIYKGRINNLDEFVVIYSGLVNQNNIVPLFSQTNKYDMFPKKKVYNKIKTRNINAWTPSIPKDDIDKIKKTIKSILNKITEKNYNSLIETLICEINKFTICDILDIIAVEVIDKIIYDSNYHEIYIKICDRIWSLTDWHENLITIIINDENNKFYWYKNTISSESNKINGPYNNEDEIRKYTNTSMNFKSILVDNLQSKFEQIDELIKKSNETDINDDIRYKYRRNIFSIIEFIGKMYNKKIISDVIIHLMILKLLKIINPIDKVVPLVPLVPYEYIEAFCILWKIVGKELVNSSNLSVIDKYFEYIQSKVMTCDYNMRIVFMLDDIYKNYKTLTDIKKNDASIIVSNNVDNDDYSFKNTWKGNKYVIPQNKNNNIQKNVNIVLNISKPKEREKEREKENEDIFLLIETIIYDFKKNHNIADTQTKLKNYENNINDILDVIIYCAIDENSKIYVELIQKLKFINSSHIISSVERTFNNIDEILLDIPYAKQNLLNFIKYLNVSDGVIKNIILSLSD